MNCLQSLTKSSLQHSHPGFSAALHHESLRSQPRRGSIMSLGGIRSSCRRPKIIVNAQSGSASSTEKSDVGVQEEKSETYSNNMTEAMGAVLTYRHELGMNYNFIRPDLIVGSCLQNPSDVDKLRKIGVKTIYCLQQDSDLEYFSVDIGAIQEYAKTCSNIEHYRAEIRDFDAFDLRMRLPAVVSKLHKVVNLNGGVTYVHCTAGLGRAPAVALAYMFWVQGYKLSEAHKLLQSKRACFPNLEAIKSATADILLGLPKHRITLMWKSDSCSSVEVSGLNIGWGQKIPLKFDKERDSWILEQDLPEGHYEYKYIVDGEWTCNKDELITNPNSDGHVNNYVDVYSNESSIENTEVRKRLASEDIDLTKEERQMIGEYLEAYDKSI